MIVTDIVTNKIYFFKYSFIFNCILLYLLVIVQYCQLVGNSVWDFHLLELWKNLSLLSFVRV